MMRKQAMTFSLLAALLGSPLVAQEPTATPAGEVAAPRRLSPEEVAAAIAAGQRAAKRETLYFSTQARSAIVAGPVFAYDMVIMSAYSRVALRAFEAKRTYQEVTPDNLSVADLDPSTITVEATPAARLGGLFGGQSAPRILGIARIVLKRAGGIIQPQREEAFDVPFSNAYGKQEVYQGRRCTFPASAFDPAGGPAWIKIIPVAGDAKDEVTLALGPKELKAILR